MLETQRVFNSVDTWLSFEHDEDVEAVFEIYKRHGLTVKKLEWSNSSSYDFKSKDFIRMLNQMPNLTELFLRSSWQFDDNENSINEKFQLNNLKRLEITQCESLKMFSLLADALPENILEDVVFQDVDISNKIAEKFMEKQQTVKKLDSNGKNFTEVSCFKNLELTHLRYIIEDKSKVVFLRELLNMQLNLISLNCLESSKYSELLITDELFLDICSLKKLETLHLNINGVLPNQIKSFSKLSNLKNLTLRNCNNSFESFKELSLIKGMNLKNLILMLSTHEVPAEIYQKFGENFNLKSLTITLGTKHSINFYLKTFPTLKCLKVHFGQANDTVEFSQAFFDGIQEHVNMKKLSLEFWGSEFVDTDMFLKLIISCPNLELLNFHSKFPFTYEFLENLTNNLGKINSLILEGISTEDDENFPIEKIEALLKLRRKLKYCNITLRNIQDNCFDPDCTTPRKRFSFEPLLNVVREFFEVKEHSRSNVRRFKVVKLTSGILPE